MRSFLQSDSTYRAEKGDWLFYKAETPVDFMATGFVYWDNLMMAQMAELHGRDRRTKLRRF